MSQLTEARERIEHAVQRLENAIDGSQQRTLAGSGTSQDYSLETVRRERDQLLNQLEEFRLDKSSLGKTLTKVEADYQQLRQTNQIVGSRLDSAIGQLNEMLHGEVAD